MARRPTRKRLRAAARASEKLGRGAARASEKLGRGAAARGSDLARQMRQLDVGWARSAPAQAVRAGLLLFVLGPLIAYYVAARRRGHEVFRELDPPVVLVANHASHLDTPTILRAMPRSWRRKTIVAAAADHFYQRRSTASGVSLLLNTVPVSRSGGGADALEHISELVGDGWNLLIYAEGTRSRDGELGRMRSGAALIAQNHGIAIVPVRVTGTHAAMPPDASWPRRVRGRLLSRRHRVDVTFGEPVMPQDGEKPAEMMQRVSVFFTDAPAAA
jgi:1-acyl-sn-glycerol-3-phosphate acyltransferase